MSSMRMRTSLNYSGSRHGWYVWRFVVLCWEVKRSLNLNRSTGRSEGGHVQICWLLISWQVPCSGLLKSLSCIQSWWLHHSFQSIECLTSKGTVLNAEIESNSSKDIRCIQYFSKSIGELKRSYLWRFQSLNRLYDWMLMKFDQDHLVCW